MPDIIVPVCHKFWQKKARLRLTSQVPTPGYAHMFSRKFTPWSHPQSPWHASVSLTASTSLSSLSVNGAWRKYLGSPPQSVLWTGHSCTWYRPRVSTTLRKGKAPRVGGQTDRLLAQLRAEPHVPAPATPGDGRQFTQSALLA